MTEATTALESIVMTHDKVLRNTIEMVNKNTKAMAKDIRNNKSRSKRAYIFAGLSLGIAYYEYKKIKELEKRVDALTKTKEVK